jgi:acetyl-CoA acetyltransferase
MSRVEPSPDKAFYSSSGLVGPGHFFAMLAQRHMHLYGTRREAFAEVAMSTRLNAMTRPEARFKTPITIDDYFNAPMIADPLCRFDFCLENDIAIAFIVTGAERARDLKQPPVYVMAAEQGGRREWGRAIAWMNMPDDYFASGGHASVAGHLFASAGIGPQDVDVAEIYDHFSPMVVMQLEDYGFCKRGEGGAFVEAGNIRFDGGSIPVNTHGGNLSEAYAVGMTHLREAVEQMRGAAINQVADAEIALVTGGPASLPVSGLLLRR